MKGIGLAEVFISFKRYSYELLNSLIMTVKGSKIYKIWYGWSGRDRETGTRVNTGAIHKVVELAIWELRTLVNVHGRKTKVLENINIEKIYVINNISKYTTYKFIIAWSDSTKQK